MWPVAPAPPDSIARSETAPPRNVVGEAWVASVGAAFVPVTLNDWVADADAKVSFPACVALIVQVPPPVKLTVEPASEQTALADGSIAIVTGRPEVDVAATAYVGPPAVAFAGAVVVKDTVCACF